MQAATVVNYSSIIDHRTEGSSNGNLRNADEV